MKKFKIFWWTIKSKVALGIFNVLSIFGFVTGRVGKFLVGLLAELEKEDPR